jgi:hypothetical protein
VPGKLTERIESRKGRHRITLDPISFFGGSTLTPNLIFQSLTLIQVIVGGPAEAIPFVDTESLDEAAPVQKSVHR